jgi:hypothetical protein
MDPDVRALMDERDVTAVITDLFLRTDQRDWPGVRDCFAPSVLFDMTSLMGGSPVRLTPAEITNGWETGLASLEAVHHQVGNFRVTVRGDEADAFCYGIALHYRKTASGRDVRRFVGSYDFGLRRAGGGWKIDRFQFHAKFVDGNLQLEQEAPRA